MGGWAPHLVAGICVLVLALTVSHADEVNHCSAAKITSCSDCLQIGAGCAYCPDELFEHHRCDLTENLENNKCIQVITVQSSAQIKENVQINEKLNQSQVAPQLMQMSLLPGEEKEVEMEVFAPTLGPLDLYILMDFSNSMSDDLDNLKRMGDQLAQLVGKISNDYTIGFGKFVDKVTDPQTDMRPAKLAQPWPNSDPPFSFRNVITLTNNITYFRQKLQKERISGNLDAPEGGFDAILQTAVCQKQIGWRQYSTHLLVFSTESAFHYEADGANVLAGILNRNDEQCHLSSDGSYTHDTLQDYPSIPTLVRLLVQHNIIPIFAITNYSYSYYEKLHEYFPIAELGQLQEDSANILSILEKAFENIVSKISIRAEDKPKAFNVQILSQSGTSSEFSDFKITPGEIGKFKVRLRALNKVGDQYVCKGNEADRTGTLRIKPTTFSSAFRINAEVLCPRCDCEKTPVRNAARCGGHGDLVCGKCQCNKGWLGPFCNCSEGASTDTSMCVAPNTSEPCMGRGDCLCGTCMCSNPLYEGNYCQFDKSQCQRFGGFLCNDRGSCSLGRCVCMPGWTGEACECPISNQTCLDSKGGICNGRGVCRCGRCDCQHSGLPLSPTCESNFQAQLGMCEDKRSCVQCQAWNTGERKGKNCDNCHFTSVLVEDLSEDEDVIESCSFRDEDDDCNYYYTVNYPVNETDTQHRVLVKKKKDCPPAGFLWLIPLIMFLILLLGLLLLCCWKYCGCCQACLALLPCCARGRMVGFKEDQYLLSTHSLFTSDYLDTPMVRTGPLKNSDIVRWKVTDNVHRGLNHPQNQIKPNPKENIEMPVSLRLNQQYSETFSRPEAQDTDVLRQEVEENLNNVFLQIPGAQRVRQTRFRIQRNSGKRLNNTIVDTVLAAPRASFPDIVKLTDKQVQTGKFRDLKIVPGYYTVATDREAEGAVEFPDDVESVDVRVPLFIKDDDDDKKELLVQAVDVPVGSAKIGKDHVNITVIKEQARSIFSFLEPSYTFSRQEGVVNIPISREIIEDGRTQVTFSSRDLTAKDRKDYLSVKGDLSYGPGETVKPVPVKLLELGESDGLLENKQVKQFVMDLSNPRQGAKLGRYPCTTVTIADKPEPSVVMFKTNTQTFSTADPVYTIPVTRSRNQEGPATVHWRTSKASRFDLSSSVNFSPGETEKNIFIQSGAYPSPIVPETFQLELFEPSDNAIIGERKTTLLNISDARGDWKHPDIQTRGFVSPTATSPGGRLNAPSNITAVPTGPQNIKLNWTPSDKAIGYKVKYWIYGDPESKAQVLDVKSPNAELTDLYAYCDYEMQVYAYNTLGEGDHSDIIPCQTPEDVPGRPGRLVFNVISPTVTQVSWAEPAKPNGVITSYEVNYTPIDEEDKKPIGDSKKVMMNKRMLLIENLQPSQAYCYKVRASTKVGWGPYRDATINLATQPIRPMSTLIIPDIPIEDAEAEEEYDSHQMYSSEVLRSPTSSLRPSVSDLSQDQFSNGKWEQNFLFSGGSGSSSRNLSSASSTSYSHSTPRQAGINQSSTTYISGASSSQRFDMSGGQLREDVTMRKRSENRHYTDNDGVRDSIIMGNMSGGILDNLGVSSFSQSTMTSYSSSSRTRTQTDDINKALLDLDSVLHESRLHPGVPETPSRLVFSAMGTTALKLSWHEPRCETDILSYCVLYQMISGGEIRQIDVNNPAQHSVVVQDLLPNQSYVFKVKAKSREGWGPERKGEITIESVVDPKSPQSPVPGSPFTLSNPSAPGPLNFTALSPDTLQLSWEKPRKPSGDILGYVVTCEQPHGREDLRSFQVSGNAATSLNVSDLRKNMPYKFKVIAQTTQGFGPEREGIMTIESQEEGSMSQYSGQSVMKREVFNMPTEVTSQSFFTEPVVSSDGMMMSSRQMTASSSSVTRRQVEVVQRSVMSSSSVTKRLERQYYEA